MIEIGRKSISIEYTSGRLGVILAAVNTVILHGRVIALFLLDKIDAKSERSFHQGPGLDRDPGSSSSGNRFALFAF